MNIPLNEGLIEQTRKLVYHGSHYHLTELNNLYAADLRIVRLDVDGNVMVFNKSENMDFFKEKKDKAHPPLDTNLKIHYAEEIGDHGYVFLTRKMNITGPMEELKYHIQWKKTGGQWQIVHENVFAFPL